MKNTLLRFWYKLIGKTPLDFEMVSYWKTKEYVEGKISLAKDGSTLMFLKGEKYPISMFPRGHMLYGPMSKLKHEIKNQIFNESWKELEDGVSEKEVIKHIKSKLFGSIAELSYQSRFDMVPPEKMSPAVREIYHGFTKAAKGNQNVLSLRNYLTFILQEDDAYRYRVQWLINYFRPRWFIPSAFLVKMFAKSLAMCIHAEVVGDMKERINLLRRILLLCLKDENILSYFKDFCRNVDWSKVALSKGDKYHFRAKYFKVDYPVLEY